MDFISTAELVALAQVILVDLVLAGDNAIVVGIAVAGLPAAAALARHGARYCRGDGAAHRVCVFHGAAAAR